MQKKEKLFAKYEFSDFVEGGWAMFEPKPDNETNAFEVTEEMCGPEGFCVIGQWGEDHTITREQSDALGSAHVFSCTTNGKSEKSIKLYLAFITYIFQKNETTHSN